jgi:hypothetical protein
MQGEPETEEQDKSIQKIRLKAPVSRQQLLRHTEDDPEGAFMLLA